MAKTYDLKLNLFLIDNLNKELIYESSTFQIRYIINERLFILLSIQNHSMLLKLRLKFYSGTKQNFVSTQFRVQVEKKEIIINAGKITTYPSVIKLIVDTNYLPKKFDDSKSLKTNSSQLSENFRVN